MKIAYIAHPISGNVEENLKLIREIVRDINLTEPDTVPFVPYYVDVVSLDDNIPDERARGMKNNEVILRSGMVDELRLYGNKISNGMYKEIDIAEELNIKVIPLTNETFFQYIADI